MDNHFIRRFPRFFSSSFTLCQSRNNEPDIVNTSTLITKTTQILQQNGRIHADSHLNHLMKSKNIKNDQNMSHVDQSKPIKNDQNMSHVDQRVLGDSKDLKVNSSSCNSLLFSSEEYGTFCSFSTASAESFRLMKLAESKKLVGRCSSEVSVRSVGSILTELTQKTEKIEEKGNENRAFSKKNAKPNEKFETNKWVFQEAYEVPGIPAELYYKQNKKRRPQKSTNSWGRNRRRRGGGRRRGENGDIGLCYIVEKSSSDPYRDFRTSIVEMMLENQIFGAQDLEKLLHCLLSLNLPCYHKVIVDVFSEICQTLYAM
ncbi:hypothetical protein LIER_36300 [Lithospermum erythrorhizon]|uniref:Transcription repressor n=1 Tax=Lithospermum erythrorhizon TaxID=34254 RepID=A0AAV3P3Z7_LITER